MRIWTVVLLGGLALLPTALPGQVLQTDRLREISERTIERNPAAFYLGHRMELDLSPEQIAYLQIIDRGVREEGVAIAASVLSEEATHSELRPDRKLMRLLRLALSRTAGKAEAVLTEDQKANAKALRLGG